MPFIQGNTAIDGQQTSIQTISSHDTANTIIWLADHKKWDSQSENEPTATPVNPDGVKVRLLLPETGQEIEARLTK